MLTTRIFVHQPVSDSIFMYPYLKKVNDTCSWIYLKKDDRKIGEVTRKSNELVIRYSSELLLMEYQIIHDLVAYLLQATGGEVDDHDSFLGYLENGESVYMMKNWDNWLTFLQKAGENCQEGGHIC